MYSDELVQPNCFTGPKIMSFFVTAAQLKLNDKLKPSLKLLTAFKADRVNRLESLTPYGCSA